MTALPLEIWETIASLAACDGGPTACAIRATCGRLREAVERIRFRVVYVSGLERIQALLRSLEDVPIGSRRVEHLYIAYDDRMDFYYSQDGLAQPWEASVRVQLIVKQRALDLCRLCAPTLHTLGMSTCYVSPRYISTAMSFPHLRTLRIMIIGMGDITGLPWRFENTMPALRQMYLSGQPTGRLPSGVLETPHKPPAPDLHIECRLNLNAMACVRQYLIVSDALPRALPGVPACSGTLHIWPIGDVDQLQFLVDLGQLSEGKGKVEIHPRRDTASSPEEWRERWLIEAYR